ncbi:MAG: hypothetical protein NV1_20 [Nanoarchaeotal virus 1]|nr:MAG: hypothetical protein NV1_20 [Nanoarchaeotal virus 1]
MGPKKNYWMVFGDSDDVDYIEKEIARASIELDKDILEMRAWIFKAFVYDPEIKAKIIEYIKKNGSGKN